MNDGRGRTAVVTGGGSGIGRELVIQLATRGYSVATCDLDEDSATATVAEASRSAAAGARMTAHACDVADRSSVERFQNDVVSRHGVDHVDLLINNAGIDGGTSFVTGDRAAWERTFSVCWDGVYNCSRSFLPLLQRSVASWLVNVSSICGFRAGLPGYPTPAYSAAKFAVKGFTEALIEDFLIYAPNVRAAVVMPGGVVTGLAANTNRILGRKGEPTGDAPDLGAMRRYFVELGLPVADASDEAIELIASAANDLFHTTPAEAARAILEGIEAGRWRILVGDDAHELDEAVRADPEGAYPPTGPAIASRDAYIGLLTLVGGFGPHVAREASGEYELRVGRRVVTFGFGGGLTVRRGASRSPVAVATMTPRTIRMLVDRRMAIEEALHTGALAVEGDVTALVRLLSANSFIARTT